MQYDPQITASSEALFTDEPETLLAHAIVLRAVDDWRAAYRLYLRSNYGAGRLETAECERFFRSKWFLLLSNLDGEALIRRLRAEEDENYRRELEEEALESDLNTANA